MANTISGPAFGATSGNLRATLAAAQEKAYAEKVKSGALTTFRLYTEGFGVDSAQRVTLRSLVARYFPAGATILYGDGLYENVAEVSAVVEVIGTDDILYRVMHLAEDIKAANAQRSVMLTTSTARVFSL